MKRKFTRLVKIYKMYMTKIFKQFICGKTKSDSCHINHFMNCFFFNLHKKQYNEITPK